MRGVTRLLMAAGLALGVAASAQAATLLPQHFSFQSFFGSYDKGAVQRGFAVYEADCASCHGVSRVHYSDLMDVGLSEADVAALASQHKIVTGTNAKGKAETRPAMARDKLTWSYASEKAAAAANHGAVPPDLSLIVDARKGGADYVYSLLMGYRDAPDNLALLPHHYYNIAAPGLQIAMPPALKPGSVTLANGKHPSVAQMAHDVASFLAWSADPTLEERKAVSLRIIVFLLFFGVLGGLLIRSLPRE